MRALVGTIDCWRNFFVICLDRHDEDFLFQSPDTDQENISRTYLQDLFGSFRFNGAEQDELREANDSDGEYQIYEQYSDGNYSDDNEY